MTSEDHVDQIKPVRFPITWLTYKARIRRDLDRAYASDEGDSFFSSDYMTRLSTEARQLDERLIKLFALQLAITGFQVVGFFGNDATVSLFSVTLKEAVGVKEILLTLYCFIAVATWIVAISRETTLTVIEHLVELSSPNQALSNFGKIAAPSAFGVKFYMPRVYEDWIFPTRANTIIFGAFFAVVILLSVAIFLFSSAVTVYFIVDIYRHPTLGVWSKVILTYAVLTFLFGIILIVRFYVPQPYRDQSSLLELKALEDADTAIYLRKRAEIFGLDSKYRRYTWTYVAKRAVTRWLESLSSIKTALLSKLQSWRRRRRMRHNWP
ncbi:MAG TPA: hypothetical protein VKR55_24000 [Bradyrhizobium sp.]|uniref:hypothetical protein n=1 Tax=Bradyrhizobium sp. TaxID=376 RepID=UPI002BA5901A|nr:hypothetical protein [Bradyrhizobium sp.]HLZ05199.1 hypothetical protein [Bradyrhizobium sp.]